jgi:hypothetical protein
MQEAKFQRIRTEPVAARLGNIAFMLEALRLALRTSVSISIATLARVRSRRTAVD